MRTERLYENDSHLRQFTAKVRSCEQGPSGWEVRLDRTAFYPEGGGQPWDLGVLGGAQVTKVLERDGEISTFWTGGWKREPRCQEKSTGPAGLTSCSSTAANTF